MGGAGPVFILTMVVLRMSCGFGEARSGLRREALKPCRAVT